jgi:hypothetical protein
VPLSVLPKLDLSLTTLTPTDVEQTGIRPAEVFILVLWFGALFPVQVEFGSKFCHSILETVGILVPAHYMRNFSVFSVCFELKLFPLIILYDVPFLINKILIAFKMNVCVYIYFFSSPLNG